LRFLGTFEVDIFEKTSFLAEIEGVKALIDDYNDGTGDNPRLPFIPDPEGLELNRLQIITEAHFVKMAKLSKLFGSRQQLSGEAFWMLDISTKSAGP